MKRIGQLLKVSGRFLFVLFILVSAFVYAMFQGGKVSWTIFYTIVPFVLYSVAFFFYPLADFKANRVIKTPGVQNGGKLVVSVTVSRNFRFPLLYTIVTDLYDSKELTYHAGSRAKKFFLFGFKKELTWEYEVENMQRGEYVLTGVAVECADFFGWIRKNVVIPVKNTVLVYPKINDIYYVPIDMKFEQGATASPLAVVKDTTLVTGTRDYQSGDRMAWIHWKSYAKTQTLRTKEFEDRRSQEMMLLLDGRTSDTFEEQVELAASILSEVSRHQAGIGFITTGEKQTAFQTINSDEQLQQALIHLAKIKPSGSGTTGLVAGTESALQYAGNLLFITGRPDAGFIESILKNVQNSKAVICFAVVKEGVRLPAKWDEDIRFAKSRGMTVHTVSSAQFSNVFKEVARL